MPLLDIRERPVAAAVNLLALHRKHHLRLALVAAHDLELGAQDAVHGPRKQLGVGGWAGAADDHLDLEHILEVHMRRGVPGDHDAELLGRAADPLHLAHIEPHARVAEQDLARDWTLHGSDHGAVLRRNLVDIVRGDDGTGAWSVLHDDRRLTRNMPCQVTSDGARGEIIAAADVRPYDDINGLSFVELSN